MRNLLLTGVFFLLLAGADAQFYNSGVFYVSSSTTVTSNGSFTNTAGATYQNDGTVYISGDADNDQPSMPAGAGTTYFNGVTGQTLNGAAPFRGFNIILNNTAGLTLANRLAIGDGVGGSLTFTAGQITTGSTTEDVYFYPGSSYTGFDAGHHIIGYVTKSGNTDFTYPIGNGTYTADLDLTGLSGTADFQVSYNGSGYGVYNTNSSLAPGGVAMGEWWEVHQSAGAASASVTLKWNDARKTLNHSMPAGLVVAHFTSGAWQSEGGSSSDPAGSATGTVGPSNAISTFSPFTFGSTITSLPILLGSFTGTEKDCQAYLAWTTVTEENAAGFDIQQSTDGTHYITAGHVAAKGTPSSYSISIAQSTQQAFYRLRLVDLDGQSQYSPVIGVQLSCVTPGEALSVYPNPITAGAVAGVRLIVPETKGAAQLQLFDMSGKRVYSAVIQVNSGINLYQIAAGNLPQGAYTLFVVGDGWKTGGVQVFKGN